MSVQQGAAMNVLDVRNVTKKFGSLVAVSDVSLGVPKGELRAIIGPNGAGKTTFFNLISGFFPPTSGSIAFDGRDITALPTHQRVSLGMARTFQVTEIFQRLADFSIGGLLEAVHVHVPDAGTNLKVEAEGRDRRDLNLPGAQQELMEAVYTANPKTVLVLMNAGPLAVTWANDHLPAILDAWYPGEAGGAAIAQVLLDDYNPGGHLPYTVYASLDGVPPQNEYDVSKGFTYLYFRGVPLYAFGHGLSYTQFKYSNLKLSQERTNTTGEVNVSFDLENSGSRAGSEVAQMYVHQVKSNVVQPIKSLRGFQRVVLEPGETKHITLALPVSQLSYYDVATHKFVVAPGMFNVMIGSSSDDIRLRTALEITN